MVRSWAADHEGVAGVGWAGRLELGGAEQAEAQAVAWVQVMDLAFDG